MRQLNFLLIFSFGLAMVMFTLENTAATTVHLTIDGRLLASVIHTDLHQYLDQSSDTRAASFFR